MKSEMKFSEQVDDIKVSKEAYAYKITFKNNKDYLDLILPLDPKYMDSSKRELVSKLEKIIKEMKS